MNHKLTAPFPTNSLLWKAAALVLVLVLFVLELITGPVHISGSELWQEFTQLGAANNPNNIILWEIRFPKALAALAGGVGLALSGMLMQSLFRNPLAGPSVLGITSGASLGVALLLMGSVAFGWQLQSQWSVAGAAILGAMLMLLMVLSVSKRLTDNASLLIFGIMLGHFTSALVSILQFKTSADALRAYVIWGMGSFSDAHGLELILMTTIVGISAIACVFLLRQLNVLLLGDDLARSMGVDVSRTRLQLLVLAGLCTGIITAFCGPIAFIGLAIPHVARQMAGTADHRKMYFWVVTLGAAAALLSDYVAVALGVPLNAITSALGAPVILSIIWQGQRTKTAGV
jgi:iron complex transport system permease protein